MVTNFCFIGKILHNHLVPKMIKRACKTFMSIQTLNLHRVESWLFWSHLTFVWVKTCGVHCNRRFLTGLRSSRCPLVLGLAKVIYTKYSKHRLCTVAHTIECVCSKINNSWFNPWFSFYLSSLYPAPYIEWYTIC